MWEKGFGNEGFCWGFAQARERSIATNQHEL
jgi:hypothetical protein